MTKNLEAIIGIPHPIKKPVEKPATEKSFKGLLKKYGGRAFAEKKSDGNRVQVHVNGENITLYSSGHNEWNLDCFPELAEELDQLPEGIYDGELLGKKTGKGTFRKENEFEAISKRPKQNVPANLDELMKMYPLQIDLFDVMNLDSEDLTKLPYEKRREILEENVEEGNYINLSEFYEITTVEMLSDVFSEMEERKLEGLIVKNPNSPYTSSRDISWCKLKIFTTWDLIVLGTYETKKSKEAKLPLSALLCGVYNKESKKYETIVKLPVSGKAKVEKIYSELKDHLEAVDEESIMESKDVDFNERILKQKKKIPSHMIDPSKSIVLEVKALRATHNNSTWHSCGYDKENAHSLGICSYQGIREDKTKALRAGNKRIQPTTTQEIQEYCLS